MRKYIILFIFTLFLIPSVFGAVPLNEVDVLCADADLYGDVPRNKYCTSNVTLLKEYYYQITECNGTATESLNCTMYRYFNCQYGCNNVTKECELFYGEEENFNTLLFYIITIIGVGIVLLAVAKSIKIGGRK